MSTSSNPIIAGCGTHHIAVQTRNLDASIAFYQDLLGMKEVARFGSPERPIVMMDTGDGSHIELFGAKADTPAEPSADGGDPVFHFALRVDDTRKALTHVRTERPETVITLEPTEMNVDGIGPIVIAFFKGPSGEIIEFFQVGEAT